MRAFIASVAVACALVAAVRATIFTGNAAADFTNTAIDPQTGRPHNAFVVKIVDAVPVAQTACNGGPCPDVGVPDDFCTYQTVNGVRRLVSCPISGWDVANLYFQYNEISDELLLGVDCFGVCGDADGDGFEGGTSNALASLGGVDFPRLGQVEGMALILDFNLDVADVLPSFNPSELVPFDAVIGVPAGQPFDARLNPGPGELGFLPCTNGVANTSVDYLNLPLCFGVYDYQNTNQINVGQRFKNPMLLPNSNNKWPATTFTTQPTLAQPDLEWKIQQVSLLKAKFNAGFSDPSRKEAWTVLLQGFMGSFADAGVGEDFMPSKTDYLEVNFPCLTRDVCDVCLGNGNTCLDCRGIPNGPNKYDACDVCGGNGQSCRDCANIINGPSKYDVCDVCNGKGVTCLDCKMIPNGPNKYDACDVCAGNGNTCLDCAMIPNGATKYDVCDVCGGNGKSCLDCKNMPNGPATYDACDVCGGNGQSCFDCARIVNGPTKYDACDVCGGNGQSCLDCAGMPNGPRKYDRCDVCGGDSSSCMDCAGTPNGAAKYDECDVCNGDGTSCICDGAQLVEVCNWPKAIVRAFCVVDKSRSNLKLTQEVWMNYQKNAREIVFTDYLTGAPVSFAVSAANLDACPCPTSC